MITKEQTDLAIKILMCVDRDDPICIHARELLIDALKQTTLYHNHV